jgi:hypothetical protein
MYKELANCIFKCLNRIVFEATLGFGFLAPYSFYSIMKKMVRLFIVVKFVFLSFYGIAQNIENDTVTNLQTKNDSVFHSTGICKKAKIKPSLITKLPAGLKETSGLLMFDGLLWTFNDGGNPAEIYQIDTVNGQVLRTVKIINAPNCDWESMAQDEYNIYIGDFGNNSGNRTNLQILKISKGELRQTSITQADAQFIKFYYPDQKDFAPNFNNNNFDCEAFLCFNDSIYLFTKNWSDNKTKLYSLPSDSGTYEAHFVSQFYADGLITDASIHKNGNIVLLGYKNTGRKIYTSFVWLLTANTANNRGFSVNEHWKKLSLGSVLHVGQTEGIFLKNDNSAFISSESILNGWLLRRAKLLKIDFDDCFQP